MSARKKRVGARPANPVLDGLAHSDETPVPAPPLPNAPKHGWAICPECLGEFERHQADKLFCCQKHRRDWNNRAVVRGSVLAPLAIVARKTRNGTRGDITYGAKASQHADMLIRRWEAEDAEANDGRGRMTQQQYLRLRYQNGYDPV